jgi:transcription elongation factor GreA
MSGSVHLHTPSPIEGGAMHETLITPAGLARVCERLERLKTVARTEVAERFRHALATEADPHASADVLAARSDQAVLERQIAELEWRLDAARVTEADLGNDVVDLGERVRLRDLDSGVHVDYELVGSLEADPADGRISAASPLGRALMGRRRGEIALVEAPKRRFRFEILAIELAEAAA